MSGFRRTKMTGERSRPITNRLMKGLPMKSVKPLPDIDGILVHCAHDRLVPLKDIKPNPRNYNKHPAAQIDLLAKNIKAVGWRHPITVSNLSGQIVAGHARLEAAKRLGLSAAPVNFQDFKDATEEMVVLLADNRLAELAEPSLPEIKDLLLELDSGALDMDLTGFDNKAMEDLMTACPPESSLEKKTLQQLPHTAWCLIAIPLSRYDEIAEHIEAISQNDGVIIESTVTNENKKNR